jgi:L-proline amide hydrolase
LVFERNGPSEFFVSGTLKTWSIVDSVYKIIVPTLLINGKYDEAQDSVMEPFFKSIEKVKWVKFAESSHLPQLEEPEEFLKVVGGFLLSK